MRVRASVPRDGVEVPLARVELVQVACESVPPCEAHVIVSVLEPRQDGTPVERDTAVRGR